MKSNIFSSSYVFDFLMYLDSSVYFIQSKQHHKHNPSSPYFETSQHEDVLNLMLSYNVGCKKHLASPINFTAPQYISENALIVIVVHVCILL